MTTDYYNHKRYFIENVFPLLDGINLGPYTIVVEKKQERLLLLNDETHSWIYVTISDGVKTQEIIITEGKTHGKTIAYLHWPWIWMPKDPQLAAERWVSVVSPHMNEHYKKVTKLRSQGKI